MSHGARPRERKKPRETKKKRLAKWHWRRNGLCYLKLEWKGAPLECPVYEINVYNTEKQGQGKLGECGNR